MAKKWNDSSKQVLRPFIVKSERGKPAAGAMFMPAETCYCVQEALKQGSINLQTKLLIIDRDRHTLSLAYHKLTEMGFDQDSIYMYCGNLQDSGISEYKNASGESYKGMIEFIYLDTCGELTQSMYRFISGIYHYKQVCKGCTISFTFSNAERASGEFLWGLAGKYTKKNNNAFSNKVDNDVNRFVDLTQERKNNTVYFADREPVYYAGKRYYTGLRSSIINYAILKIIGKTHKLVVGRAYKEQGISVPMFTARYEPKTCNIPRNAYKKVPMNLGYN